MLTAITQATIFTGHSVQKGKTILCRQGKIEGIVDYVPDNAVVINLPEQIITPGLIDIQLNGGYTKYFANNPGRDTLTDMYNASWAHGTPWFLPTLVSSSRATIMQAIEAVRSFKIDHPTVPGMHLEGPFLNHKKRGAHNPAFIRLPTDDELDEIIMAGAHVIKLMTIAPECFSHEQLKRLLATGINLSIGHSVVDYEAAQQYFDMGIGMVTHLYNAMPAFGHREPGLAGAALDNAHVYTPIILDGAHVHYAAARIAYRCKKDKLLLLTDSSFLGRQQKQFGWLGQAVQMDENGFYRNEAGDLAGAAISMPEAVENAHRYLGVPFAEAVEMATSRVAKALGIEAMAGFIEPGYPAVFTVFEGECGAARVLAPA